MDILCLRRRLLCRKLWKARSRNSSVDTEKNAMCAIVKQLSDAQLTALVRAIKQRFSASPDGTSRHAICVPVEMSAIDICPSAFVSLCCRLWRSGWSRYGDVDTSKLLPMPQCTCLPGSRVICCNPYHWTVDVTPVPPDEDAKFTECCSSDDEFERRFEHTLRQGSASCKIDVDTTSDKDVDADGDHPWCRVAYREYRDRVGMQRAPAGAAPDVSQGSMAVHADELHVFADLHDGTAGLCLSALRTAARSAVSGGGSCSACNKRATSSKASARDAVVKKTLTKVGHGLVLSRRPPASSPFELSSGNPDGDGVWLYNCSEFPVFVDSRSLRASTAAGSGRFDVCRILPGQSVRVYERRLVDRVRMAAAAEIASGCCENIWSAAVDSVACYDSVLVSFVKGWSGRYKRQTVMSCPCWLEIIIYESNFDR